MCEMGVGRWNGRAVTEMGYSSLVPSSHLTVSRLWARREWCCTGSMGVRVRNVHLSDQSRWGISASSYMGSKNHFEMRTLDRQ
jgi:hypothetical protein